MKYLIQDKDEQSICCKHSVFESMAGQTWLSSQQVVMETVSRLTNVSKVFGADLFDLVEAGIQIGRLFRQGGNCGHVWTDLLTVHWTSQTHTQQAGGQVCNIEVQNVRKYNFVKTKVMCSNVLFCLMNLQKPKDIQFIT